jgi:hypothetical protein
MKRLNLFTFLLLTGVVLSLTTGCDKDEHDNTSLTIEVISPTEGSKVSNASNVLFHVKFTADEELHEYKVEVTEKGKSEKILDIKGHEHEKSHELRETRDLSSYPDGTEFELKASSCYDHDCEKTETRSITFTK